MIFLRQFFTSENLNYMQFKSVHRNPFFFSFLLFFLILEINMNLQQFYKYIIIYLLDHK